ncbi:hypothetical protein Thal_1154 [Thermocrinis albus DSM 14484]|uniref:Uncharacterized protein n=1 Tax=Thermocrinis albus (strain DSM 14484 / JCM 11386 / HI 11/12) TaxID=638303 RepID=D3SM06_THEAH|nr:hypothetical protein [Thermocrinis albus]ADC89786.1 hypothetical protein Thal_1154 [Thermocrinis albus DSM 14484]
MRFFVTSGVRNNKPLFFMLASFSLLATLFWITSWFYFYTKYGFSQETLFRYFFTDSQFPEKIPLSQLLETVHIELFLHSMFLLVLGSILLLSPSLEKLKIPILSLSFITAFLYVFSDLIIYTFGPTYLILKVISFVAYQTASGSLVGMVLFFLFFRKDEGKPQPRKIKKLLLMFSFSILMNALVNLALFTSKMGISPSSVQTYYLGDPTVFSRPKTLEGLTKILYPHILAVPLYLFVILHLLVFTGTKRRNLILLSVVAFLFSFTEMMGGLLVRFLHPSFSLLKLVSFALTEIFLFYASFRLMRESLRKETYPVLYI